MTEVRGRQVRNRRATSPSVTDVVSPKGHQIGSVCSSEFCHHSWESCRASKKPDKVNSYLQILCDQQGNPARGAAARCRRRLRQRGAWGRISRPENSNTVSCSLSRLLRFNTDLCNRKPWLETQFDIQRAHRFSALTCLWICRSRMQKNTFSTEPSEAEISSFTHL